MARTRLPIVLTALLAPPLAFAGAPSDLDSLVRERLDALSAQSTLYARHLPTGRTIAVRADEPMNTVSVIKLPIMVLAYRDAEAGRLDFDERYVIRLEDLRRGTGLLQTFAPGLAPTWRDLVAQMIITSDNTATDILIGRLGQDRVNEMLTDFPCGSAFRAEVGHKTGDWPPIIGNDVGIVYAESGPIVIAAFTNQNRGSFFELEAALGKIGEDLLDAWGTK